MNGTLLTQISSIGTTNMATDEIKSGNELDALGICRIIRESAKCKVVRLKLNGLEIDFDSGRETPGSDSKLELTKEELLHIAQAGQPETNAASTDGKPQLYFTPEQEKAFEEFQEAQLMIEDPLGFEEMILDHDIDAERVRANVEAQSGRSQQVLPGI